MLANPTVRIVNNWLHDVGTGLWAACLLVIWLLEREIGALAPVPEASIDALTILSDVQQLMFWVLIGALVDIAITGALRLVYWRQQTPAEEMPAKRPALIGKHVVFLVVYGGGTLWAWTLIQGA